MSVINRMLADLEQRGAPSARGAGALYSPTRPRRRPREPRTVAAAWLLVPLSAVAVALWLPPGVVHLPDLVTGLARAEPDLNVQALPDPANASSVRAQSTASTTPMPPAAAGEPLEPVEGDASRSSLDAVQSEGERRASVAATHHQQQLSLQIDSALAPDEPRNPAVVVLSAGATAVPGARSRDAKASAASAAPKLRSVPVSIATPPADPDAAAGIASRVIKRAPGSLVMAGNAERAPVLPGEMSKDDRSTPAVRAQRRYSAARELVARGENHAARMQLRDVLALDEAHHGARDLLVALSRRIGEHGEARDLLARGLELAPGRAAFATPYARLLVDAGELDRAARVLAGASASGAGDAEFHALAAAIAQQRGQHDEAVAQYTRAIETRGGREGRLWLGLGISLAASGRDDAAHRAYRTALDSGDLPPRLHDWARSRLE